MLSLSAIVAGVMGTSPKNARRGVTSKVREEEKRIAKEVRGIKLEPRAIKRDIPKEDDTKEDDTKEEDTRMRDTKRGRGKELIMEESQGTKEDGREEAKRASCPSPSGNVTNVAARDTLLKTVPRARMR